MTFTTEQKIAAAAAIIKDGALELLANKEGITVSKVREMILSGHEGACRQFKQLVECGILETITLHNAGSIHLVGI